MDALTFALGAGSGAAISRALARYREHRTEPAGLSDLLTWAFLVDDGVILQKDGSLLASWRFRGPDISAATLSELGSLAQHVNDTLLPLAGDKMLHVDAVRRPAAPYPPSRFPDAVTQLLDDERRAAHSNAARQFESDYLLTLTYVPPAEVYSRLTQWFVQGVKRSMIDWNRVLADYDAARAGVENRIGSHLRLERLGSDAFVTYLHECLTALPHPVRAPAHGAYLNVVLADQDLVGGFEPRVGTKAIRVVAVQGYPPASHAGQLDLLNGLPYAYRWSTRVIPLGSREAGRVIHRMQLNWFKKRKGAVDWVSEMFGGKRKDRVATGDDELFHNFDARRMAADAAEANAENSSGTVRFCLATQAIVVAETDTQRANMAAGEILKAVTDAGFTARIETVNALDAFLGTLPGHGYPNLRRVLISSRNVSDLLPVTSTWPGLPTNPCPYYPAGSPPLLWAATDGATPFRVNLHTSDVGHALIIGPTGSGKSVFLGLLAAQFRRYEHAQVFAFDVGYSMWSLSQATGGVHYDLAAGRPDALCLQPLQRIDDPSERAWAAGWLETLVTLQGVTVSPALRTRIDRALSLLAANAAPHRTLTELTAHVQNADLAAALRPYTVAGNYGQLLDSPRDDLSMTNFVVFEMRHLLALDPKVALPVLLYLFRRIEQRLNGCPTLVPIDEAWIPLSNSAFGAKIKEWLLTWRKQNAAVVLATQSLAQLAESPHRHVVFDSCPTRFYLPNPNASSPDAAAFYKDMGLNEREIDRIREATPKRHYYYTSPRGSRLFELGLGPIARTFLGTPPGLIVDEVRREVTPLIAEHGHDWPACWLERLSLTKEAEQLRSLQVARSASADSWQSPFPLAAPGVQHPSAPVAVEDTTFRGYVLR